METAVTGRTGLAEAVRAAVRDEVRAFGLLGNGDRERLIRIEERHRSVEQRVEAIEAKIDALAGELKGRDERAEKRFVTRAEAADALGDVRKVRWMIVAAVVAALLAVALQGKAAF